MGNSMVEEDPHNNSVELVDGEEDKTTEVPDHVAATEAFSSPANLLELVQEKADDVAKAEASFENAEASLAACNENVMKLLEAIKGIEGEIQTLEESKKESAEGNAGSKVEPNTVSDLRLHEAAREDDIETLKKLLEGDDESDLMNVKNCDVTGRTALFDAAAHNSCKAAAYLMDKGLSPNATTLSLSETPLMEASSKGHLAVVKLLVERGATLDARDAWVGETALQKASRNGHWAVAKFLLLRRCDANCQDESGRGPVHWAAGNNDVEGLSVLFEYGADLDLEDLSGSTPLHNAAQKGKKEAVAYLAENATSLNLKDNQGLSPLCIAAMKGDDGIAEILVANGARSGVAVHLAAIKGNGDMITTLIRVGSDATHVDEDEKTPLMDAAFYGKEEAMRVLIEHYKSIGEESIIGHVGGGHTALSMAVVGGNSKCVQLLLDNGADLGVINEQGWSALHQAAVASANFREAVSRCIHVLVDGGARVNQTDIGGRTPLYLASYVGAAEVVMSLIKCGAEANIPDKNGLTPLHQAVANDHLISAKVLLNGGADPNLGEHEHRWNCVHQAVLHERHEALSLLLDHKGNVNAKDVYGNTALHLSVFKDDVNSAMRLLDKGCDIEAKDENGQTALHHAACRGAHTLLLMLLQQGANADNEDMFGVRPLDDAIREDHTLCAKVLAQHGATAKLFKVKLTAEGQEHDGEVEDVDKLPDSEPLPSSSETKGMGTITEETVDEMASPLKAAARVEAPEISPAPIE